MTVSSAPVQLKALIFVAAFPTLFVSAWTAPNSRSERVLHSPMSKGANFTEVSSPRRMQPETESRIKLLGVCGGIGSGKSSVCALLLSDFHCFALIDSDSIAHSVYEPGSTAIGLIAEEFGADLLLDNGELDRKKLGAIVFANDVETTEADGRATQTQTPMQRLEQIVWPHVRTKIELEIEKVKAKWNPADPGEKLPIIIIEAAVLIDAGWQQFLDGVWAVSVSHDVALSRLVEKRGLTEYEAEKRIAAQQARRGIGNISAEVNAKVVTAVIENNGSLHDLKDQIAKTLSDPRVWYEVLV